MSNKGKVLLSLFLILGLVCASVFESKRLEITRIDGRCRGHKVPIKSDYRITKADGYVVWFSVNTTVTEDIPGTSSITADITRCTSRENLDTCQPYQEFKTNYCTMLSVSSLTPFSTKYTPPFRCPFKKGIYRSVDNKIDFSTVLMMPMEKYYWKINLSLRDNKDNKLLSCIPKLKKLDITRIDGVCRSRRVPIRIYYQGTKSEGNVLWFNITTAISEDIKGKSKVLAKVDRCSSRENLNTCQDYIHTQFDYCQMLDISSMTPFYIDYKPKLKCPFRKDTYRAVNSKIDLTPIIALPLDKWYWKINVDIVGEDERLLSCIVIEAYSIPDIKN